MSYWLLLISPEAAAEPVFCGGDSSGTDVSKQCLLCRSYGLDVQSIALAFAEKEILLANSIAF